MFALAGLACSGFFPMTIGYGESSFPGMVELAAGWLIAAYQIGYGLAAFGGGALQDAVSLSTLSVSPPSSSWSWVCCPSPSPAARRPRGGHPIWTMTNGIAPRNRRTVSRQVEECVMPDRYDVIVIGTGAGGGTLAHTLAASGKRILLLERGNFLPRETQNWEPEPVFVDGRYISPDTWYDADGTAFQPQVHYFVGGATKLYGAALYRLRPQDFGEIKHADGISPAWPVSYDEFEPWYTKAEWLYQVHGNHGEDPTEGHWSKQYPWPAVSHEPRIQGIADDLAAAGYHPFSAPCGILLDEADRARSTCIRCTWCDGYPCMVHAKSDAETIAVRPLLMAPNVTLLVEAEVVKLETDASGGSVTGVVVSRAGKEEAYEADIVVLSAGASNSAKILLQSANDQHPNGLANGSDQVGRNYMFHNSKAVVALAKERNDTVFQKTLGLNDFYLGGTDDGWPLGQHPDGRQVQRLMR